MNKTDELLLKLMVTLARDRQAMQGRIRSVGFMREYSVLPDDLGVHTLSQMDAEQIEILATSVSIKTKSDAAHFHLYLNDTRYRLLKSEEDNIRLFPMLALEYFNKLCSYAGVDLTAVIPQIEESHMKLTELNQESMKRLMQYCLSIGNEYGIALHQAEGVFIFEEVLNMNSWTLMSEEQAIAFALEHGALTSEVVDGQLYISIYMKQK